MQKITALLFFNLMLTCAFFSAGANPAFADNATPPAAVAEEVSDETPQNATVSGSTGGAPGFGLYRPEFQEDASYNFRKVRWGMSPAEVEAAMGERATRNDTNPKSGVFRMGYKGVDLFGVDIWLVYSFVNDKLWGAGYAKDYAGEGEFEIIAAEARAYYGDIEPFIENKTTEYEWEEGPTQIILRLVDDPRRGRRIFFNYTSEELSPDPVVRRRMFAP